MKEEEEGKKRKEKVRKARRERLRIKGRKSLGKHMSERLYAQLTKILNISKTKTKKYMNDHIS